MSTNVQTPHYVSIAERLQRYWTPGKIIAIFGTPASGRCRVFYCFHCHSFLAWILLLLSDSSDELAKATER